MEYDFLLNTRVNDLSDFVKIASRKYFLYEFNHRIFPGNLIFLIHNTSGSSDCFYQGSHVAEQFFFFISIASKSAFDHAYDEFRYL
jgi:hypothetical protein